MPPVMPDEMLIYMIKEHPSLWDKNDRYYRDKLVKLAYWRKIAAQCNFSSVDDCKAKWKALREKYRRELVLEDKFLRTGNTQMGRPNWYLMNSMAFIKDSMTVRSSLTNLDGTFPNLDEDTFNDNTQEYIEIKGEPVMELVEDEKALNPEGPSAEMNGSQVTDAEMSLHAEDHSPEHYGMDQKVHQFDTNSNPDQKYNPFADIKINPYIPKTIHENQMDDKKCNRFIPRRFPCTSSMSMASNSSLDLANLMKQIADAVTKIRTEGVEEPDSKISAFTTYLKEELKQLPTKECEDLIDDIILQVLTVKKKVRNDYMAEIKNKRRVTGIFDETAKKARKTSEMNDDSTEHNPDEVRNDYMDVKVETEIVKEELPDLNTSETSEDS